MSLRPSSFIILLIACQACTEQAPAVLGEPMPMVVPGMDNALGARLSQGPAGATLLSWMERDKPGATLKFSRFQIDHWLPARSVVNDAEMFVNWADLPGVTATTENILVAHWLSYSADATYAYDVRLAQSSDNGDTWSDAFSPHTDGTPSEHGFVSVFATPPDSTGLIWLDGRKTVTTPTEDPTSSGMTLRSAAIGDSGELTDESIIDDLVCDCCQTDVAMTDHGPVAVYRNRSIDEIRDIYVTRHRDGQWQPGVPIANDHWKIAGCPVNGPAIDADGKRVVIAWFSAADERPVVRSIASNDAGASFSAPVEIAIDRPQGRVGIALINAESYAVSWLAADQDGSYAINIRTVTMNGDPGNTKTIGRTSAARIVPQMVRVEDELIIAWPISIGERGKIVSVKLPILGFYDN